MCATPRRDAPPDPTSSGMRPMQGRAWETRGERGTRLEARTVLQCYQRPDEDRLKKALDERRHVHSSRE